MRGKRAQAGAAAAAARANDVDAARRDTEAKARSRAAWELAQRQHGIVTRSDLLGLGFSPKAIKHRLATGRLHRIARGVYAVGWWQLTSRQRWMAAILACGKGAALSHRSAAAMWGIGQELDDRIDVSVRRNSAPRRAGIRARRRPSLPSADIAERDGIPVTGLVRTFVDLATELGRRRLERAVNDADKLDLIDPEELWETLDRYGGDPGVRLLRAILDPRNYRPSDSNLEILFRSVAASAGLPLPKTQQMVNGFKVDFYWPELGLVVETDSLLYHRTPAEQLRDHTRDQAHTAAGLSPLRFTESQVKFEPDYVRRILMETVKLRTEVGGA